MNNDLNIQNKQTKLLKDHGQQNKNRQSHTRKTTKKDKNELHKSLCIHSIKINYSHIFTL